jgi:hypothetical protein
MKTQTSACLEYLAQNYRPVAEAALKKQNDRGRKIHMGIYYHAIREWMPLNTVDIMFLEDRGFTGTQSQYSVRFVEGETPKIDYIEYVNNFVSPQLYNNEQVDTTIIRFSSIMEAAENLNEDFGLIEFIRNDLANAFPTILDGYTDPDKIGSYGDCQHPETVPAMAVN